MANTLSDARFEGLRFLGYRGSTSDMLLAWLKAESIPALPKSIPDAWKTFLEQALLTPVGSYHRNDWWYQYLGQEGFTGAMNDREILFWNAILAQPPGGFSDGFSNGFEGGFI